MSLSVTRENFDEWMVPVYIPRLLFLYAEKAHACGISRKEYIDFAGGSRSTPWDMRIRRCARALNEQANRFWHTGNGYTMNRRCDWRKN